MTLSPGCQLRGVNTWYTSTNCSAFGARKAAVSLSPGWAMPHRRATFGPKSAMTGKRKYTALFSRTLFTQAMWAGGVDARLQQLGVQGRKFRLPRGKAAHLGGADRREIGRVGRENDPFIPGTFREPDFARGREGFEVGGLRADAGRAGSRMRVSYENTEKKARKSTGVNSPFLQRAAYSSSAGSSSTGTGLRRSTWAVTLL